MLYAIALDSEEMMVTFESGKASGVWQLIRQRNLACFSTLLFSTEYPVPLGADRHSMALICEYSALRKVASDFSTCIVIELWLKANALS